MLLIHANWSQGRLHLWGEVAHRWAEPTSSPALTETTPGSNGTLRHPYSAHAAELAGVINAALDWQSSEIGTITSHGVPGVISLRVPTQAGLPAPSPTIAHAIGHAADEAAADKTLGAFDAETLSFGPEHAGDVIERLEESLGSDAVDGATAGRVERSVAAIGSSVSFFAACARLVRYLLAQQRVVPALVQAPLGELTGLWQPWLADAPTLARLTAVMAAMPPSARCGVDGMNHDAWLIVGDFLAHLTDAACRRTMTREELLDALGSRDPAADTHVAWLTGLLGQATEIRTSLAQRQELLKGVRTWIGMLEDRGAGASWRLLLRLAEPIDLTNLQDFDTPGDHVR